MENKVENKMENKIYKVTVDCGDGRVNEIEGDGIIAIALTQEDNGGTRVEVNIEGGHSVKTLVCAIKSMRKGFREIWDRANMIVIDEKIGEMLCKLLGDKEPTEAPDEEQTETPTEEQAEAEGNYGHV